MARRNYSQADVDEDGVLFEMPNESVDDIFDDDGYPEEGVGSDTVISVHAVSFNLPMESTSLSFILSMERQGKVMIRDKQVFPCPKEGYVQVYVEYVDVEV